MFNMLLVNDESKELERKCVPCGVCEGTGLQWDEDRQGILHYSPCEGCIGEQCYTLQKDGRVIDDYYLGPCDESCGHNREQLREQTLENDGKPNKQKS